MRLFRILSAPSAVLLLAMCAPGAFGTSLSPGQSAAPIGPTILTDTYVNSTADTFTSANYVSGVSGFSGTLYTEVAFNNVTGGYDFLYQFTNNGLSSGTPTSIDPIDIMSASNFAGYTTDVYFDPTQNLGALTGTVAPTGADRTSGTGEVVDFDFQGAFNVTPGSTSDLLVVETNATSYSSNGNVSLQNTSSSPLNFAWQPAGLAAPEPAEAGVLLGGLFAAGLFVARKFRVQRS